MWARGMVGSSRTRLPSRDQLARLHQDLGDDAAFEMLHGLQRARRQDFARGACDLLDLRDRRPDDEGEDTAAGKENGLPEQPRRRSLLEQIRL
jgi:hypothetical protein